MWHLLYEENSVLTFLLVSIVLGGGAAWLAGRAIALTWRPMWAVVPAAIALTWRPMWAVVPAAIALGLAVRFFHHALFGGTLLSLHYLVVDTLIIGAFALAGYRMTRSQQMARQYGFLHRN
jgi:hypothetical protein